MTGQLLYHSWPACAERMLRKELEKELGDLKAHKELIRDQVRCHVLQQRKSLTGRAGPLRWACADQRLPRESAA